MTPVYIQLPTGKVISYADEKAAFFFVTDASAVGSRSYDAWVASPDNQPNAFTPDDLGAVNRTMRGRSAAIHWTKFTTGKDLAWIKALKPDWDLIEMPANEWQRAGCADRIGDALAELNGNYRRAALVTKILHLKRPRLIPICDSFVAATMNARAWGPESTAALILSIRDLGQANANTLRTIAFRLESIGVVRSSVRILDALLWFDAPYEGPRGTYGLFEDWLVGRYGGRLFF